MSDVFCAEALGFQVQLSSTYSYYTIKKPLLYSEGLFVDCGVCATEFVEQTRIDRWQTDKAQQNMRHSKQFLPAKQSDEKGAPKP